MNCTDLFSLIAIMLGRLRMSVDECIETYEDMMPKIFPIKKATGYMEKAGDWGHKVYNLFKDGELYGHRILENEIQKLIEKKLPKEGKDAPLLPKEGQANHGCRTYGFHSPTDLHQANIF
jgi:hypothetical protein